MGFADDLHTKIENLVFRQGVHLAERRIARIKEGFRRTVIHWRLETKILLSKPAWKERGRWVKNTDDMPHRRTGNLLRSIPLYKITARKTVGPLRQKLMLGETNIQLKAILRPPWTTYGETLNNWGKYQKGTKLTNWKDRAYQRLDDLLEARIRSYEL